MESLTLTTYLFTVTFIFLSWLITPVKSNKIEANDKSIVTEEVISIEKSITLEKLNSLKHIESFESEPIIDEVNIKERSEHSLTDLDNQQFKIDISKLRLYKLHGERCVRIADLPKTVRLPQFIKRYKLRGQEVIKISQLEVYLKH